MSQRSSEISIIKPFACRSLLFANSLMDLQNSDQIGIDCGRTENYKTVSLLIFEIPKLLEQVL